MTELLPSLATLATAALGVWFISFMKGAFGGGFAVVGIPLLSLVMTPLEAGALLAPLFLVMDFFALRYWKPHTWSRPDLRVLVPACVVGIGAGYFLLRGLDRRAMSVAMALVSLGFVVMWLIGGAQVQTRPRHVWKGVLAGTASGVTSMVAHSGGPPLAMYLLPLGLPKAVYAGTSSMFFTVGNVIKVGPWLFLATPDARLWTLTGLCLPFIPFGVWAGWRLHERLDQRQMTRACYGLLVVTSIKLLWDGLRG